MGKSSRLKLCLFLPGTGANTTHIARTHRTHCIPLIPGIIVSRMSELGLGPELPHDQSNQNPDVNSPQIDTIAIVAEIDRRAKAKGTTVSALLQKALRTQVRYTDGSDPDTSNT